MLDVTLEQARTLDAFAREGTLQAAAKRLHKTHPAVLYALKQLRIQTGLELFDRTGYRTRLTTAGEAVLVHCRAMLDAERALESTCAVLQSGWESAVRVVFDTILPLEPFFSFVREVRRVKAPTRVVLSTDSLGGVTARFEAEQAHVMVTILPVEATPSLEIRSLRRLKARLVAHRSHPLARASRLTQASLADHVLLTVRGSDPRLQLPTADLDRQSAVHLSDFHAKKDAIMAGLGFGWLPEWLIERELRTGALKALSIGSGAVHTFEPRAVVRAGSAGKATRLLLSALSE